MVAGIPYIPVGIANIGYAIKANLTHRGVLNFAYHPVIAYHTTFVMLSIDKITAIAFPEAQVDLTHYAVIGTICISWLLAIVVLFYTCRHSV